MSGREEHLADLLMKEAWERATIEAMCRSLSWRLYKHDPQHSPDEWVDIARADVDAATRLALSEEQGDEE